MDTISKIVIEKWCDPSHPTQLLQPKMAHVIKPSLTEYNKVGEVDSISFLNQTLVFGS